MAPQAQTRSRKKQRIISQVDAGRASDGFPADVVIPPRLLSVEQSNIVIAFPVERTRKAKKSASQNKPSQGGKLLKNAGAKRNKPSQSKLTAKRTPKATAAARQNVAPAPPPPTLAFQPVTSLQEDRVAPLPRAAAVTLHRKTSFFDVVAYWLRQRRTLVSSFFADPIFVRLRPIKNKKLAQDNASLRAEIDRLKAMLEA
jgi:hypothetical protein